MNETSPLTPQHLCSPLFHTLFCFLVPFWCIPSLIWLWRRGAIENLVERVFMADSAVRWLSQRRMLIRQPRLRLIWLAAVTLSSCSQSVPRLFPPLHCSAASFLSLSLFSFFIFFFLLHAGPPLHSLARLSCTWSYGLFHHSCSALKSHHALKRYLGDVIAFFSFCHYYFGYHLTETER